MKNEDLKKGKGHIPVWIWSDPKGLVPSLALLGGPGRSKEVGSCERSRGDWVCILKKCASFTASHEVTGFTFHVFPDSEPYHMPRSDSQLITGWDFQNWVPKTPQTQNPSSCYKPIISDIITNSCRTGMVAHGQPGAHGKFQTSLGYKAINTLQTHKQKGKMKTIKEIHINIFGKS